MTPPGSWPRFWSFDPGLSGVMTPVHISWPRPRRGDHPVFDFDPDPAGVIWPLFCFLTPAPIWPRPRKIISTPAPIWPRPRHIILAPTPFLQDPAGPGSAGPWLAGPWFLRGQPRPREDPGWMSTALWEVLSKRISWTSKIHSDSPPRLFDSVFGV